MEGERDGTSIEQLRQERESVGADLSQWTGELGKAEKRRPPRRPSCRSASRCGPRCRALFGLLLESEEMRTEKLQSVAQELEHIEGGLRRRRAGPRGRAKYFD